MLSGQAVGGREGGREGGKQGTSGGVGPGSSPVVVLVSRGAAEWNGGGVWGGCGVGKRGPEGAGNGRGLEGCVLGGRWGGGPQWGAMSGCPIRLGSWYLPLPQDRAAISRGGAGSGAGDCVRLPIEWRRWGLSAEGKAWEGE